MRMFFILSLLLLVGCKEVLMSSLTEAEANKLYFELLSSKISAEKQVKNKQWQILVEEKDLRKALEIVVKNSKAEVVKKQESSPSLFNGRQERVALLESSKAEELERVLKKIQGVVDAQVLLSLPQWKSLSSEVKSGASAVVVVDPSFSLSEDKLKMVIASAVAIKLEEVALVMQSTKAQEVEDSLVVKKEEAVVLEKEVSVEVSAVEKFGGKWFLIKSVVCAGVVLLIVCFLQFSFLKNIPIKLKPAN